MTKQEEIREYIYILIEEAIGSIRPEHHPNIVTHRIIQYLHSQGVVIKVDGELPFVTSDYTPSAHGVYVRINKEALNEQGYVAVENLIKEKGCEK